MTIFDGSIAFVVQYTLVLDEELMLEETTLTGVYSTEEAAASAVRRGEARSEFQDPRGKFEILRWRIGEDAWETGFGPSDDFRRTQLDLMIDAIDKFQAGSLALNDLIPDLVEWIERIGDDAFRRTTASSLTAIKAISASIRAHAGFDYPIQAEPLLAKELGNLRGHIQERRLDLRRDDL